MYDDSIIMEAIKYARELFKDNADGHGIDHTLRVYQNAMIIANSEPKCDKMMVALAALLHDADDHKLFSTKDNENTRGFLSNHHIEESVADSICDIINSVSFSKNRDREPDSLEGKIVQDADRLDAIGARGIARTFAFGGSHGRTLDSSIEHFHEKLLLLKDMMNTDKGKEMAESRHAFMVDFLQEWKCEVSADECYSIGTAGSKPASKPQ